VNLERVVARSIDDPCPEPGPTGHGSQHDRDRERDH
jgi:hypothetical protein